MGKLLRSQEPCLCLKRMLFLVYGQVIACIIIYLLDLLVQQLNHFSCLKLDCPPDLTKVPKPRKPPAPRIQTTIDPVQDADVREESSDLNATEAITSDPLFLVIPIQLLSLYSNQ